MLIYCEFLQAPDQYIQKYAHIKDNNRRTYLGMHGSFLPILSLSYQERYYPVFLVWGFP